MSYDFEMQFYKTVVTFNEILYYKMREAHSNLQHFMQVKSNCRFTEAVLLRKSLQTVCKLHIDILMIIILRLLLYCLRIIPAGRIPCDIENRA